MPSARKSPSVPSSASGSGPPVVPGFRAAGIHSGIKKDPKSDLVLVTSDPPARVAGLFTRNRVKAAPVLISQARVRSGLCKAVLINSGNANACTGEPGRRDAVAMSRWAAEALGIEQESILIASTGVVGERLPLARIRRSIPALMHSLRPDGLIEAAEAIRTTDRFAKFLSRQSVIGGRKISLFGMAKGAGMICPDLATLLAFFLTDLNAPVSALRRLLKTGAGGSFNRISVDGDASTNDTVLLLANGMAGNRPARPGSREFEAFADVLYPFMEELASMIVQDGEGATKVAEIQIRGARSKADARTLAYKLANSALVKTSFYGEDINWGRLMVALGCAGPPVASDLVDIFYDGVQVVRKGISAGKRQETLAKRVLRKDRFTLTVDLHLGKQIQSVLTSDLTHAYVTLNASYRS